jgi:hypothetical protein
MRTVAIEISLLLFFNEYGVVWTAQFTLFAANAFGFVKNFYFFNFIYFEYFFGAKGYADAAAFAAFCFNF